MAVAYLLAELCKAHVSLASRLPGDEKVPVAALELVATAISATSLVVVGAVGAAVVVSTVLTDSTEELVAEVVLVVSGRA